MIESNGQKLFGCFKGMEYDANLCIEEFSDYLRFDNLLSKETILRHILSQQRGYSGGKSFDIFTGEEIGPMSIIVDGEFTFPADYVYYMEHYDIGIPPEYEQYLIETVGLK